MFVNGGYRNKHLAYGDPTAIWQNIGVGDINGDQRDDIIVRDSGSGAVKAISYTGINYQFETIGVWDQQGTYDHAQLADLNGDGADEIVAWNSSYGAWWAISKSSAGFVSSFWIAA